VHIKEGVDTERFSHFSWVLTYAVGYEGVEQISSDNFAGDNFNITFALNRIIVGDRELLNRFRRKRGLKARDLV
tara:strand:- start:605 stop:826 length:222 start_codon:yes stop_codon:yes gene_type:complete